MRNKQQCHGVIKEKSFSHFHVRATQNRAWINGWMLDYYYTMYTCGKYNARIAIYSSTAHIPAKYTRFLLVPHRHEQHSKECGVHSTASV